MNRTLQLIATTGSKLAEEHTHDRTIQLLARKFSTTGGKLATNQDDQSARHSAHQAIHVSQHGEKIEDNRI